MAKRRKRGLGSYESDELGLYIANDEPSYRMQQAVHKNLCNKRKRGRFKATLAPKAFKYLTDYAAKRYACEFDSCKNWNKIFPVAARKRVAHELAVDLRSNFTEHCGAGIRGVQPAKFDWGSSTGVAGVRRKRRRK